MYVLDTDVLSLTNTASGFNDAEVEAWRKWVGDHQQCLYLSVITLMEVRYGVEKVRAKGATNNAEQLAKWLASAETAHRGRLLPVTIEIARKAGEPSYRAVAAGMAPSSEDAIIAATADVKGSTVLSRNAKDMAALGANWRNSLDTPSPN